MYYPWRRQFNYGRWRGKPFIESDVMQFEWGLKFHLVIRTAGRYQVVISNPNHQSEYQGCRYRSVLMSEMISLNSWTINFTKKNQSLHELVPPPPVAWGVLTVVVTGSIVAPAGQVVNIGRAAGFVDDDVVVVGTAVPPVG